MYSTLSPLRQPHPYLHKPPFQNKNPIFTPTHFTTHQNTKPLLRKSLVVAKFGFFNSGYHLPDPDNLKDLFGKVEGLFYTLADAAVTNTDALVDTGADPKQNGDWFSGITMYMETILKVLKGGLTTLHVPYSYGFAIILLTVLMKALTFPLSKKQVESTMAMRSLQPQIKAIQERYAGDQERIQLETARVYKLAGINPLAGCLPTLATIPVWIGLYRALSNVANEGLLSEGFFWIPSLAGPTTVAARQSGSGISWLFPFIDGQPPLGWSETAAYLVLPVLLIVSQYISIQIMQSNQPNDPNTKSTQAITQFLPLMIGYFSLSVPSGLSLYWLTNNILSTAQQVWLQKMGGAKIPVALSDDILKEELPQPLKTVSVAKPVQTEETDLSTGPRPGERFKRLKEEEARKKRQRDLERMQAGETSVQVASSTKQENEMKDDLGGVANGVASREGNEGSEAGQSSSASSTANEEITSNGNATNVASKDHSSLSNPANGRPVESVNEEQQVVKGNPMKETVEVQSRVGSGDRDETS